MPSAETAGATPLTDEQPVPAAGGIRPGNVAAWLDRPYADLQVRPAPYRPAGPSQIVIRNRAVAVNPLDDVVQGTSGLVYRWLTYPCVLGEDVAGEVVEVGSAVTRFRVGDRVLAYAVGLEKGRDHQAEGGFQAYSVVEARLAAPVPDALSFEEAAVLPLGVSTAASALFQTDNLGLRHPTAQAGPTGEAVLVWGGSTSVGSNAIQLAVAAGYHVMTTASPHNHEQARQLGASDVVDYRSPSAITDLTGALRGRPVAGVLAIGTGSAEPSVAVAAATGDKRVCLASLSVSLAALPRRKGPSAELVRVAARMVASNVALRLRCRRAGVRLGYVWGSSLMRNEVGAMLWEDYLPAALAEGRHRASPALEVVGVGLDHLQPALNRLRDGVSARKIVVCLA